MRVRQLGGGFARPSDTPFGPLTELFPPEALARLRDIKRRRDPHGVFRGNFPVLR